jgi:hypothetical protein
MEKKSEYQASIQSHLYSLFVPQEILNSFSIASLWASLNDAAVQGRRPHKSDIQ